MTEEELAAIRNDAKTAMHGNIKAWTWRCAACLEAVEMIKAEVGCDDATAKLLFVGWTMENAATVYRECIIQWQETMDRHYPVAKRMLDLSEEELKRMKDGEGWRPEDSP